MPTSLAARPGIAHPPAASQRPVEFPESRPGEAPAGPPPDRAVVPGGIKDGEKTISAPCCTGEYKSVNCKPYLKFLMAAKIQKQTQKDRVHLLSHLIRMHIKKKETMKAFKEIIAKGTIGMGHYFGGNDGRPKQPPQYSHWEQKMRDNWEKCKENMDQYEYARNYAMLLFGFAHNHWFPGLGDYKTLDDFVRQLPQVSNRSARAAPIPKLNHPNHLRTGPPIPKCANLSEHG